MFYLMFKKDETWHYTKPGVRGAPFEFKTKEKAKLFAQDFYGYMRDGRIMIVKGKPITMICSVCGRSCIGRQFYHQDKGKTICSRCSKEFNKTSPEQYLRETYGLDGINYFTEIPT